MIQEKFSKVGVMNPLDGVKITADKDKEGKAKMMTNSIYLIAVPSYFRDTSGNNYHMY